MVTWKVGGGSGVGDMARYGEHDLWIDGKNEDNDSKGITPPSDESKSPSHPMQSISPQRGAALLPHPQYIPPPPLPQLNQTPFPPSNSSACLLKASALNLRNAVSILLLDAGSRVMVRDAAAEPTNRPVSPPRKMPAMEKKA